MVILSVAAGTDRFHGITTRAVPNTAATRRFQEQAVLSHA
jgi:hypothetical protein